MTDKAEDFANLSKAEIAQLVILMANGRALKVFDTDLQKMPRTQILYNSQA